MTKKIIALFLVLSMLLTVAACSKGKTPSTSKPDDSSSVVSDSSSSDASSKDEATSSEEGTSSEDEATSSEETSSENEVTSSNDDATSSEATSSKNNVTEVTSTVVETVPDVLQLDINNSKVFNEKWNGVNAINQGFMFLPDEYGRDYNDAQIKEELKRMDDMDINMVRSYMDAGYAFKSRSGDVINYDWDSERMKAFYKWLDAMEERDIEVAVQMGWSNGSIAGGTTQDSLGYTIPWYQSGKLNIYSDMIDMYTDWVELFIREVIIKRGYDIEYLVMFTEPYHSNAGGMSREYEVYIAPGVKKKLNGWDVSVDVIKATDKKLKDVGLRDMVKLTGPQYGMSKEFCEGETLEEEINWWIDRIGDCIDVYTFHWYCPTWPGAGSSSSATILDDNYDLWLYYFEEIERILEKTGKPFWFDEWNYGGAISEGNQEKDFYAQQVAQTVIAGMNAGLESCLYWQLFEIVWPTRSETGGEFVEGIHAIGTAPSLYESAIPYKLYYGLSLLFKHAGEKGSKVYTGQGEKGVCCTMVEYEKDGKKYQNVIVVNSNSTEQKISINFDKKIGKTMYRYAFDPIKTVPTTAAEMIKADKGFKNVQNILQDTIPAGSIVVYSTVKE